MKKAKRMWSLLLVLCLIVTQLPATALAETTSEVFVGDTALVVGKRYRNDGSGRITEIPEEESTTSCNVYLEEVSVNGNSKYVLTLNNADISGVDGERNGAGIYYETGELPLEIVLSGSNKVCAKSYNSGNPTAIRVHGNSLTITGKGDLTADAREHGSTTTQRCYGIDVSGEGCSLSLESNLTVYAGVAGYGSYAISAESDTVTIKEGANVKAISGETTEGGPSEGVSAKNVLITGGTVTATASKAVGGVSAGIYASSVVNITGGTVTATGGDDTELSSCGIYSFGDINISNTANVTATGQQAKINSIGVGAAGNVAITGSAIVMATGGIATKGEAVSDGDTSDNNCFSYGIGGNNITISDNVKITANGGEVQGVGASYGIGAVESLTIHNAQEIIAKAGNVTLGYSYGIGATGGITIANGEKISATGGNPTTGHSYGIGVQGLFEINGGNVTANGGVPVNGGNSYGVGVGVETSEVTTVSEDDNGITLFMLTNAIRINGGKLSANGATAGSGLSYGMVTTGDINVTNGTVDATGGNDSLGSVGLCASNNLDVDGGTIKAKGGNVKGTASVGTPGTGVSGGNSFGVGVRNVVDISGGDITAQSGTTENGNSLGFGATTLKLYGTANLQAIGNTANNGSSYGLGISGNCDITGGNITATGGNATNGNSYGGGISGYCNISGGTVIGNCSNASASNGNSYGLGITGTYKQSGGKVTATGGRATGNNLSVGNSYGLGSNTNVNLSGDGTLKAVAGIGSIASIGCGAIGSITGELDSLNLYISGNTVAFGAQGTTLFTKNSEEVTITGTTYTQGNIETDEGSNGGVSDGSIYIPTYQYYNVNVTAGKGGTVTTTGNNSVQFGQGKTYIITPDEGYEIADVLIDGVSVGAVTSYTFESVYENHTIEVKFVKKSVEEETKTPEGIAMTKSYGALGLKSKKVTDTTVALKWKKNAEADGYVVYGSKSSSKAKKITVIKDNNTNKFVQKDLKAGTHYKYYIKAYKFIDGEKVFIEKSQVIRVATTGGEYGNVKAVKVNEKSVTLKAGESFTIKAEQVTTGKKVKNFKEIRFESSDIKVAMVDKEGVITVVGSGSCTIYVYAQNGVCKKVAVTVE